MGWGVNAGDPQRARMDSALVTDEGRSTKRRTPRPDCGALFLPPWRTCAPPQPPLDNCIPSTTVKQRAEQRNPLDVTTATQPPQAHALYRFYADDGTLLYVGITLDPGARWRAHRDDKPWWQQIVNITVETYTDRCSVLDAERAAIIAEQPRYNIVHNRRQDRPNQPRLNCDHAWVEPNSRGDLVCCDCGHQLYGQRAWGQRAEDMPDECHDHCARAGILSIYYPYRWADGQAHYQCANGHTWTCGWGHNQTGNDEQWRGARAAGPWPRAAVS